MSEKKVLKQEIENQFEKGLLNLWYPVLPSWALGDTPIGITRLSRNIVLWRDREGHVHALEDRCPHRGARLSLGWNLGDRLACWYHGVEVGSNGKVEKVPAVENCSMEGKKTTQSYPVTEIKDAIFLYFSDAGHSDPPELVLPNELAGKEFGHRLCTATWKCNYIYAVDNVMDPMHGAYLHAKSHSMAFGDKTAKMRIRETATGLSFEKIGQRDINFDWVEVGFTGGMWLLLSIPYRKNAGPGGSFYIVGYVTPIDEEHTQVFFWRTRKVQGWKRDVWKFMYKNSLEGLHWDVLEQDRVVLENLSPNARDFEGLNVHDVGLTRVRHLMKEMVTEQLSQLGDHKIKIKDGDGMVGSK